MRIKAGLLVLSLLSFTQGACALSDSQILRVIIKYKQQTMSVSSLKSELFKKNRLLVRELKPLANGTYSLILESFDKKLIAGKESDIYAEILETLRENSNILYAVKDRIGYFKPVPEPKVEENLISLLSHDSQWDEFVPPAGIMLESKPGLKDGAWSYTDGSSDKPVVVAVLDTGIVFNDSLNNNLLKDKNGRNLGWNFAGNNNDLSDETKSFHGTHVAGTIAGYGNVMNGIGEQLKILTIKIPNKTGMFYESAVINAIYWAVGAEVPGVPTNKYPAKVLNMSFGVDLEPGKEIDYCDEALQEAVFFARKQGAVLAAAAGNDNIWEHFNAPAVCNGTMKIASTGPEGLRSYFSNYGPSVSFAAPGGDKRYGTAGGILSTVNSGGGYHGSGFDFYQGTSMATPHVAGVAGLIFAVNKQLKAEQVEQILYITTHNFGKSSDDNKSCIGRKPCGHGILNAENAVKAALNEYDVLFSAPGARDLSIKKCTRSAFKSADAQITVGNGIWIPKQRNCQSEEKYQHPYLQQEKDGAIYAYYGSSSYKLDQTGYKECQIIGYDGVGCYF